MSLNTCTFIGNLGADPEIRAFPNGDKVANLRLAVTEKWKDKTSGERKERTEWVQVAVFGPLAGVCEQYLRKGSKVFISGKLATRKWQDKNGNDRYSTEIVLQGPQAILLMLDGKQDGGEGGARQTQVERNDLDGMRGGEPAGGRRSDMDDEIPFMMEWR